MFYEGLGGISEGSREFTRAWLEGSPGVIGRFQRVDEGLHKA